MFKAWLCIPSAREQSDTTIEDWRSMGYGIAVFRDKGASHIDCDFVMSGDYPGYAAATNRLALEVLRMDPECSWCIAGGDDVQPDLNNRPESLALQLQNHFRGTFGVCQFTGDKWGSNNRKDAHTFTARAIEPTHLCYSCGHPKDNARHMVGSYIDRVAGSPWMGREWCLRANQGKGPLWPEFTHMFGDQCLRDVAVMLGVYWERPDLVHLHKHWGRVPGDLGIAGVERMPEFLKRWNTTEHWNESKAVYERLKANGFKECMPL